MVKQHNIKVACKDCGKIFVKKDLSRSGYCIKCGIKEGIGVSKSMHDKKGATYERYKVGMKRYVDKL